MVALPVDTFGELAWWETAALEHGQCLPMIEIHKSIYVPSCTTAIELSAL